ncbi:MAG: polysaccharide biosynthesis C-terminal domain-containing protein [Clostridia bacterium]|nr:polysaccharide biosynthesis C-terminal domain-containing protein [Clostridia bacterium]
MEAIRLSDHFTYKKLLKFAFSPIIMMIFTSIYGVVDGLFVSNCIDDKGASFEAVNFIMPYLMILGVIGFMFGTGGGALVAKHLGMGERDKANSLFSLFVYLPAILGVIIAALGILCLKPVAILLGAKEGSEMLSLALRYGQICLLGTPFAMLQIEFQGFFATAEKPKLGLVFTVASGVTNIVLDALFIPLLGMGIEGAAIATVTGQIVGCVGPVIYFARPNSSLLKLTKFKFNGRAICQACLNGSSELMSNISMSLVGMLYNFQLLKYAPGYGIISYGVLMYVNFIFISAFIGYTVAVAPIISYNYGAGNHKELRNVLKKSIVIIAILSLSMFALSEALSIPLAHIFVSYSDFIKGETVRAFLIFSFSFLFAGFAIFGSSFFTALNNGPVSAIISFLRTLVFQVIAVFTLPLVFPTGKEVYGIWLSVVIAEALAVLVTIIFMVAKRKKYNY